MKAYIDANPLLGEVKVVSAATLFIELISLRATLSISGISTPVVNHLITLAGGVNTVALALIVKDTSDNLKQTYNDALATCVRRPCGPSPRTIEP